MNTFGTIKTKIERATVILYGKPEFKSFMKQFKSMVLENKDVLNFTISMMIYHLKKV